MPDGDFRTETVQALQHLAARWTQADKRLLRHVFPLLVQGRPVTTGDIADLAEAPEAEVLDALQAGRAGFDAEGRVVELSGLMLAPSMHRVEIDGVACFCCCAVMAHLVPLLIGRAVNVESVDPVSRRVVRLQLDPGGPSGVDPPDAVGSLVRTDAASVMKGVAGSFCSHVRHFESPATAASFVADDARRYPVSIAELHAAAGLLYREVWS